jgi:riboflavin kinase/FMN adenylyltransferase
MKDKDMEPMNLAGTVTRFKGNGRKLGYPTANLTVKTDLADGIYFGLADLADWADQPAVVFIGTPTTMGDEQRRVEVHLFDIPDKDYYDQPLSISIRHYHRPSRTFKDIDQLLEAMQADMVAARQWLTSAA